MAGPKIRSRVVRIVGRKWALGVWGIMFLLVRSLAGIMFLLVCILARKPMQDGVVENNRTRIRPLKPVSSPTSGRKSLTPSKFEV